MLYWLWQSFDFFFSLFSFGAGDWRGGAVIKALLGKQSFVFASATQGEDHLQNTEVDGLSLVLIKHNSGISHEEFQLKIAGKNMNSSTVCSLYCAVCVATVLLLISRPFLASGQWVSQPVGQVLGAD